NGSPARSSGRARVSKDEDAPHASRRIAVQPSPWKNMRSVRAAMLLSMRSQGLYGGVLAAILLVAPDVAQAAAGLDGAALRWPCASLFLVFPPPTPPGPFFFRGFWHRHYGKLAFAWSVLTLAPLAAVYGTPAALAAFVHTALAEYLSFI